MAGGGVPGPDAVGVKRVERALELAGGQATDVDGEVAVDIVGVRLVLDERAIEEDVGDADGPELADEGLGLVDEVGAPVLVPLLGTAGRAEDEGRSAELGECGRVVSRREEAASGEGGNPGHSEG